MASLFLERRVLKDIWRLEESQYPLSVEWRTLILGRAEIYKQLRTTSLLRALQNYSRFWLTTPWPQLPPQPQSSPTNLSAFYVHFGSETEERFHHIGMAVFHSKMQRSVIVLQREKLIFKGESSKSHCCIGLSAGKLLEFSKVTKRFYCMQRYTCSFIRICNIVHDLNSSKWADLLSSNWEPMVHVSKRIEDIARFLPNQDKSRIVLK